MKKIITRALAMLLILCMTAGLAACGKKEEIQVSEEEKEKISADAYEVARQLRDGEYQTVYDRFDENMKGAVTLEQLTAGWEQVAAAKGEYVGNYSFDCVSSADGIITATVILRYTGGGVELILAYDENDAISGLRLAFAALETQAETGEGWTETEVTVAGDESLPLSGLLTLPEGVEKPAVVILVQGSGSSDMNETIGTAGNTPFKDIAHGLAAQGIAVLRYDKRSLIYPETFADLSSVTIEQEMLDDLYAAIDLMESDGRVDAERVFVLGHSLGGMMTPRIAADRPELAGVISMAGTLRQLWQVVYDQNMEAVENVGEVDAATQAQLDAQVEALKNDFAKLEDGSYTAMADSETLMGIPVGYWKTLADSNGMKYVDSIEMPMFIFQGSADFQVYADVDYPLWEETLGGRENVSLKLYDGLNHLMMPTTGLRTTEDYNTAAKVSDEVIADIAEFVKAN